jgi:hypothetical protein
MSIQTNMLKSISQLAFMCLCLLFCSCSPKAQPSSLSSISSHIKKNLQEQAEKAVGMRYKIIAQIVLKNQPQPKFKAVMTWAKTPTGINIRLTGIGALGVPIFDYLSLNESIYLSMSSDDLVYWANAQQGIKGQDMRLLMTEIRLALAPWDTSRLCDMQTIVCDRQPDLQLGQNSYSPLLCNKIWCNNGYKDNEILTGLWAMDSTTMAPEYLALRDLEIFYKNPRSNQDSYPYPTDITIKLLNFPLEIRMELKELETTDVLPQDPAFDPTPFLSRPALHMDQLLMRIQE